MSASLPPPERRRLRRRAALAAWRRRLARALLRHLRRDDGGGGADRAPAAWGAWGSAGAPGARDLWPRRRGLGRGDRLAGQLARPLGQPLGRGLGRRLGRPPERWPRLLLAWQAGLVGLALALTLQSLLAPRWPRAELPREWGSDRRLGPQLGLGLGERRLRRLRTLPGQRDRDRALSETLVLEVQGGLGPGSGLGPGLGAEAPMPLSRRSGAAGALELRVVAAQVRKRSDLAVPRLVRDRPDLRLSGERLERLSPRFSYARGWLRGRPALQTCLTGAAEAGYSEAQLSRLRDQPLPWGWPRVLYILGLRDNRDFSCLLLTLSTPEKANNPQASRQPAGPTSAP